MDFSRITSAIDVKLTETKKLAIIGLGGAAGLAKNVARCGVRRMVLFDFDTVEPVNIPRQDHFSDMIGQYKTQALSHELWRINSEMEVDLQGDFCELDEDELGDVLGDVDALVLATDSQPAQARGNEVALRLNKPVVAIGLYEEGVGGEAAFWRPGLPSCLRCLLGERWKAYAADPRKGNSQGSTILEITLVDCIAAMLVIGLLTRGSNTRYGHLIDDLGDRQFLQVKIDPDWTLQGVDPVAKYLEIPPGNDAYFSFCTVARRDPDRGQPPCPDCLKYRQDRQAVSAS